MASYVAASYHIATYIKVSWDKNFAVFMVL